MIMIKHKMLMTRNQDDDYRTQDEDEQKQDAHDRKYEGTPRPLHTMHNSVPVPVAWASVLRAGLYCFLHAERSLKIHWHWAMSLLFCPMHLWKVCATRLAIQPALRGTSLCWSATMSQATFGVWVCTLQAGIGSCEVLHRTWFGMRNPAVLRASPVEVLARLDLWRGPAPNIVPYI
eukprot:gene17093-biopygen10640